MREAGCGMRKGGRRSRGKEKRIRHPVSPIRPIDRTYKMFIGGTQARPGAPYPRAIVAPDGRRLAEVGEGNRKDIRNAVEAARAAEGWAHATGHTRGQILYYIAENLATRTDEFAARIGAMTGFGPERARAGVDAAVPRLFTVASWADKDDGQVHPTTIRGVTLAMNEPIGVLGIAAPEELPLLGFVSLVAPAIAVGNTVVAIPSEAHPLAATELYSVLETSDVPAGVINIVTGSTDELSKVLADHLDVDAMWYIGNQAAAAEVERASAGNRKRTWPARHTRDGRDACHGG